MSVSFLFICIVSCFYCLLRPFHRDNVYHTSKHLGKVTKFLGFDVEVRVPESVKNIGPVVYVANHQNNYDMVTTTGCVQPGTVTIGKKSLVWIPFFGIIYWLTGNIIINRENQKSAKDTIKDVADQMREKDLSVMIFPEGTRSRGRGLMPFKMGAFHENISHIKEKSSYNKIQAKAVKVIPLLRSIKKKNKKRSILGTNTTNTTSSTHRTPNSPTRTLMSNINHEKQQQFRIRFQWRFSGH